MNSYRVLKNQSFSIGEYSLVPIRFEDRYKIMQWRNEQIYHLRQNKPLTEKEQDQYFNEVVAKLFEQDTPGQILFSYLENGECIGYGGLVHINWVDKNAEISFLINTTLEKNEFHKHWKTYLQLLGEIAFKDLKLHKLYTYAFDLRPQLYNVLEQSGFTREAILKNHINFNNSFIDVVIHSKFNVMEFESERLKLIDFDASLLDDKIMGWFENEELMKYYTNSKNKITKKELLDSIRNGQENEISFTHFIVYKNSNSIIGTIKVGPITKAHKISDLVALIGERGDFGKGIGTEAIELGNRLAFERYGLRKLFGGMYASNIASIKAYTRAGWIVEGVLKGHYLNDGKNEDRILVGCFNPRYFTNDEINGARYEDWYNRDK